MAVSPPRDSSADDLTRLRARAYGPDADIWQDPAAMARLAELESAQHPPPAPGAEPSPPGTEPGGSTGGPADTRPGGPAARRMRGAWIAAWAASIVVVGVAVGLAVHATGGSAPSSAEPEATLDATLDEPAALDTWIRRWFVDKGVGVTLYSYRGLLIARAPVGSFDSRAECLFVVGEQDIDPHDGSVDGDVRTGCGAGAFPATVQFVVDTAAPSALRERFADGTGVRIVSDGGVIEVFVSEIPHADAAGTGSP